MASGPTSYCRERTTLQLGEDFWGQIFFCTVQGRSGWSSELMTSTSVTMGQPAAYDHLTPSVGLPYS